MPKAPKGGKTILCLDCPKKECSCPLLSAADQMKYCSTIDDLEDDHASGEYKEEDLTADDPIYQAIPAQHISYEHLPVWNMFTGFPSLTCN